MTIKKRTIAVDFDDVIARFNEAYIAHHSEYYVTPPLSYAGATTYDLTVLYGVDLNTMLRRIRRFCHQFHDRIQPHAGVDVALTQLRTRFNLHIVTSRCETLTEITASWLREFDLLRHITQLHFTNAFGTAYPVRTRSKLEVCREIGAVALVEDAPGNALSVAEAGIRVLMPERPWNTSVAHAHVCRYRHWKEVSHLLS